MSNLLTRNKSRHVALRTYGPLRVSRDKAALLALCTIQIKVKVKVKLYLCLIKHHASKMYGRVAAKLHAFIIMISDEGGQLHTLAAIPLLPTGQEVGRSHKWPGQWEGEKSLSLLVSEPPIPRLSNLQPNYYTAWAVPAGPLQRTMF